MDDENIKDEMRDRARERGGLHSALTAHIVSL